jgi:hypothetical protein
LIGKGVVVLRLWSVGTCGHQKVSCGAQNRQRQRERATYLREQEWSRRDAPSCWGPGSGPTTGGYRSRTLFPSGDKESIDRARTDEEAAGDGMAIERTARLGGSVSGQDAR